MTAIETTRRSGSSKAASGVLIGGASDTSANFVDKGKSEASRSSSAWCGDLQSAKGALGEFAVDADIISWCAGGALCKSGEFDARRGSLANDIESIGLKAHLRP